MCDYNDTRKEKGRKRETIKICNSDPHNEPGLRKTEIEIYLQWELEKNTIKIFFLNEAQTCVKNVIVEFNTMKNKLFAFTGCPKKWDS